MATQVPLRDLAEQWLQQDRDQTTRAEIEQLLNSNDDAELERRLRSRIAFGTAGLRASMKAGFAHMNSLTVLQASQGLARYVREQQHDPLADDQPLAIVVGHDARHNSEKFARLAAAAFLACGFHVLFFEELVHTPMVPFAVQRYKAAAGVMVTASHNPAADNGYKVYWSNGCQIIPPHDVGIARAIDNVRHIDSWDENAVDTNPAVQRIFADATEAYFKVIDVLVAQRSQTDATPKFVYTPMHGVGLPFMRMAVKSLGLPENHMTVVATQAYPDPDFPTVPFPNPEEKGALNLAMQAADESDCSLVLANDPDADRFAVAERLEDGQWHQFTGNQMGILLASHVLETWKEDKSKLVMLASTVSSRMLAAMAKVEGFHFRETLTGFKWLGNVAQGLREESLVPAFAYEEAIGYMFPSVVWDKDGIAAAAVFLLACQRWKQQGLTPWLKLQSLYQAYGYFEDANTYLITPSSVVTEQVFASIRASGVQGKPPASLGSRKILRWRDLTKGYDSASVDGKPDLPIDATAQMITCELERVTFTTRGSGTEPKIKLYIEAKGSSSASAKVEANQVLQDLLSLWFKPEFGLRQAGTS